MAEKKSFFYNFIPSKAEEEACKVNNTPWIVTTMAENNKPLITKKKTFVYKVIPSKAEEEVCEVINTPWIATREVIEIRDIYPAPKIDLKTPWQIKKRITRDEVVLGKLEIPFFETFQYVLRYWKLDETKSLVINGYEICVYMWDVTEENDPKIRYISFKKLRDDNFVISSMELFNDRGLGIGDEIGIYWDPRCSRFMFKLLSKFKIYDQKMI